MPEKIERRTIKNNTDYTTKSLRAVVVAALKHGGYTKQPYSIIFKQAKTGHQKRVIFDFAVAFPPVKYITIPRDVVPRLLFGELHWDFSQWSGDKVPGGYLQTSECPAGLRLQLKAESLEGRKQQRKKDLKSFAARKEKARERVMTAKEKAARKRRLQKEAEKKEKDDFFARLRTKARRMTGGEEKLQP